MASRLRSTKVAEAGGEIVSDRHLTDEDRKAREFEIKVAQITKGLEDSLATEVIGMQSED